MMFGTALNLGVASCAMCQYTASRSNSELEKIGDQVLNMAKEKLTEFKNHVSYELEVGHPSERIIALAKKEACDSIVIGSRGLSSIAEFFLGSVSAKVSQYSSVPVLIVK